MKNVAFGQYYPAKSLLHAMDARIKVVLSVLYIVAAFLCKTTASSSPLPCARFKLDVSGQVLTPPIRVEKPCLL